MAFEKTPCVAVCVALARPPSLASRDSAARLSGWGPQAEAQGPETTVPLPDAAQKDGQ